MSDMWMGDADRICHEGRAPLLGEDDYGDLWVGSDQSGGWRRYSPRKPLHRLAYWRSKRRNVLVWLERTWS